MIARQRSAFTESAGAHRIEEEGPTRKGEFKGKFRAGPEMTIEEGLRSTSRLSWYMIYFLVVCSCIL